MQAGVIDLIRKDDELYFDLKPENFDKHVHHDAVDRARRRQRGVRGRVYEPFAVTFKLRRQARPVDHAEHALRRRQGQRRRELAGDQRRRLGDPVDADRRRGHGEAAHRRLAVDLPDRLRRDRCRPRPRRRRRRRCRGCCMLVVRPTFSVDATKSYYLATKAFPRNDEISVNLTFNGPAERAADRPRRSRDPDRRCTTASSRRPSAIPSSFRATPTTGSATSSPRASGTATTRRRSPFERFIERWNLDNGPITFYLTDEIPKEYRDTVRRGILAWNDAFAKIGHPNAIVVKDPPSDPTFDPDDARYTTVRWITSDQSDFSAYSPHVSDPDTGQIIRADRGDRRRVDALDQARATSTACCRRSVRATPTRTRRTPLGIATALAGGDAATADDRRAECTVRRGLGRARPRWARCCSRRTRAPPPPTASATRRSGCTAPSCTRSGTRSGCATTSKARPRSATPSCTIRRSPARTARPVR